MIFFSGGEEDTEPGDYSYPFAFTLPYQLPTSFEGVYGSLRYYVRAQLLRRYTLDAVFKKGFTLNNIVDLNLIYQAPVSLIALPIQRKSKFARISAAAAGGLPRLAFVRVRIYKHHIAKTQPNGN